MAADHDDLWEDVKLRFAPASFCIDCKVATSRSAARGHKPVSEQDRPGQVLFMDLIHNPSKVSLTASTLFPYYLLVVCALSRYGVLIGCKDQTSTSIIQTLEKFATDHRPHKDYTLQDISEIHADAGFYFMSQELSQWAQSHGISVIIAGAHHHQEMNGLPERRWQAIRLRAFCMLNHASLTHPFLHHALMYSWQVTNILPVRGLTIQDPDSDDEIPATPFQLYFGKKPRISRFRVFGCPIVAKCYVKKHSTNNNFMDDRTIIQRGIRGIFTGFPINQAGYLFYQPTTREEGSSVDVSSDEYFHTPLAYPDLIFRDALPTRDPTVPHSYNYTFLSCWLHLTPSYYTR